MLKLRCLKHICACQVKMEDLSKLHNCGKCGKEGNGWSHEVFVPVVRTRDPPHNHVQLLELVKSLDATYLHNLHLGGNAHYTSERCMQEALISLGGVISERIFLCSDV